MNDAHDNDLRERFARQRQRDRGEAPVWRGEWLRPPVLPSRRLSMRWIPISLATACVALAAVVLTSPPAVEPALSELPPLFEARGRGLFASLEPDFPAFDAPSDFLLPTHLNPQLP